jgi:hypothetical protein
MNKKSKSAKTGPERNQKMISDALREKPNAAGRVAREKPSAKSNARKRE